MGTSLAPPPGRGRSGARQRPDAVREDYRVPEEWRDTGVRGRIWPGLLLRSMSLTSSAGSA
ncbi:hypothetical protein [Streptomyces sp. NPDC093568]|uniref:hypothetical protein n=1 Tax=Streptomyces sp. NPDC093568 TaxID=3366041 RepID=UPI00380916D8